jgi:sulfopyruvate decarboxylase TPP-binding subunit
MVKMMTTMVMAEMIQLINAIRIRVFCLMSPLGKTKMQMGAMILFRENMAKILTMIMINSMMMKTPADEYLVLQQK